MSSYLRTETHMEKPQVLASMGLLLCGLVHRNARMTEMERSGIEVILAFADNVRRSIF